MVRNRRFKCQVYILLAASLSLLSTNCAFAKEADKASSPGDLLFVAVTIAFATIGAVLFYLERDNRKKIEDQMKAQLIELQGRLTQQIELAERTATATAMGSVGASAEAIETVRKELMKELDNRLEDKGNELLANINAVDSTLSRQVQEITGSVTKQVRQITESVAKHSADTSETITKEFTENSETKFLNLRNEYKSALKAMAKVVDQQMTTLQKMINENQKEVIDLFCASKFVELLDDPNFKLDASIDMIRKHANEQKIIDLAKRFPSTNVIHVLRLLSDKAPAADVSSALIQSSLSVVDDLRLAGRYEDAARSALQIIDSGRQLGVTAATLLPIVRTVSDICKMTKNISIAEQLHEEFVKLASDGSGAVTQADVAQILDMYKDIYPAERAEEMHRRIHNCMQVFGGEFNADALNNLAELVSVLTAQSRFPEAHTVLSDIASGLSKTESSIDSALPAAVQTAVHRFFEAGRIEEALDVSIKFLDVYKAKKALQPISQVVKELHAIALKYQGKNDFGLSADIELRSFDALKEVDAPRELQLEVLNNLTDIYLKAERWQNLAKLVPDLIAIGKMVYGAQSEEVIERTTFGADVYARVKDYDQAITLLEQGLISASKVWGDYGDKTMGILNLLADLFVKTDRYSDAEVLYRRVLDHQEQNPDVRMGKTFTKIGDTLFMQKDYAGAEGYFKRALDVFERESGSDHDDVLAPLTRLGNVYMAAGRYKDAEPFFKRVLEIKYKTHGEHSDEIITSLIQLGELYGAQSNFAESEVFLETALETAQQIYDHDDTRLADVMLKYAKVLTQVGKDDESVRLIARADKIKAGILHKVEAADLFAEHAARSE